MRGPVMLWIDCGLGPLRAGRRPNHARRRAGRGIRSGYCLRSRALSGERRAPRDKHSGERRGVQSRLPREGPSSLSLRRGSSAHPAASHIPCT